MTTEKSDALTSNTIQEITDFFIKPEEFSVNNLTKRQTKKKTKTKNQEICENYGIRIGPRSSLSHHRTIEVWVDGAMTR